MNEVQSYGKRLYPTNIGHLPLLYCLADRAVVLLLQCCVLPIATYMQCLPAATKQAYLVPAADETLQVDSLARMDHHASTTSYKHCTCAISYVCMHMLLCLPAVLCSACIAGSRCSASPTRLKLPQMHIHLQEPCNQCFIGMQT